MPPPQRHTQCQSKAETLLMERLKARGDYQSVPCCCVVPLSRAQRCSLPFGYVAQGNLTAVACLAHFCSLFEYACFLVPLEIQTATECFSYQGCALKQDPSVCNAVTHLLTAGGCIIPINCSTKSSWCYPQIHFSLSATLRGRSHIWHYWPLVTFLSFLY